MTQQSQALDEKGMEAARRKGREIAGNQPGALVEAFAEVAAAGVAAYLAALGGTPAKQGEAEEALKETQLLLAAFMTGLGSLPEDAFDLVAKRFQANKISLAALSQHPVAAGSLVGRLIAFAEITPEAADGFSRLNKNAQSLVQEAAAALQLLASPVPAKADGGVTEGWQLVPIDPTPEMLNAAISAIPMDKYMPAGDGSRKSKVTLSTEECAVIYRSMLAAHIALQQDQRS